MSKQDKPQVLKFPDKLTMEDMTEQQMDEILAMEKQLTIYQLSFLAQAKGKLHAIMPMWHYQNTQEWAETYSLAFHQVPEIMTEDLLTDLLQVRKLETLGLVRKIKFQDKVWWQLTARGHLTVVLFLGYMQDYQQDIDNL
ncbi:hypothetical protein [Methylomonas sp. ZR1]|uniref:hypothetical protein n=1 Tax=Methylomonas sp. ZR1 TaxID=1797072 RepID=UPI001492CE0B|nr:hypothetical protein [Methylomonas sp. ZR1]